MCKSGQNAVSAHQQICVILGHFCLFDIEFQIPFKYSRITSQIDLVGFYVATASMLCLLLQVVYIRNYWRRTANIEYM